jgi:CO dehydrogenase/acetyl-CoA synthase beta subunit
MSTLEYTTRDLYLLWLKGESIEEIANRTGLESKQVTQGIHDEDERNANEHFACVLCGDFRPTDSCCGPLLD